MEVSGVSGPALRAQVERIAASASFRRKDSLRRLFLYLADRTFDGTADSLKEYAIGVSVFGKPESYDPQTDSSVRVQLGRLRQALDEYYAREGRSDSTRVELPPRHFALQFSHQIPGEHPAVGSRPLMWRDWRSWTALAATLLAGIGIGMYAGSASSGRQSIPGAVRSFWAPILDNGRPALVCVGTPLFVSLNGRRYRDPRIDDFGTALKNPVVQQLRDLLGGPAIIEARNYTGVGEAAGAFLLAQTLGSWPVSSDIRRTTSLTWEEIGRSNVIFLGPAKFSPQIRAMPSESTFAVEQTGIRDIRPASGQRDFYPKSYEGDEDQDLASDHALVSRLPGVEGGEMYLLNSSSSAGTWAAARFVTQQKYLEGLERELSRNGPPPRHFEAIIRARFRSLVPVEIRYITHRALPIKR
jgi:hypothetical protein